MNFFLPVEIQHHVELLGVAVEEEDGDGAGNKSITQILDLSQAGCCTDLSQARLGVLPEVGEFRSELLPADIEDHTPGVFSLIPATDESSLHFYASRGNFQGFFELINFLLISLIFILSKNKVIKEVFLCIFTS